LDDTSQNRGLLWAYCSFPWLYVSVESRGGGGGGDDDDDDDCGGGDGGAVWGKLLTRPPELSGNHTSRDVWERVG
jgi:hypothetical protein